MSGTEASQAILEGVFRELVARQIPLGLRDYLDALRALRSGFGGSTRAELRWLCQRLWARSETDLRAIDLALALIPVTDADDYETRDFERRFLAPQPDGASGKPPQADGPYRPADDGEPVAEPRAGIFFAPPGAEAGIPLPRLAAEAPVGETYVFRPQTVIGRRELGIVWRRLRTMTRDGPARELDIPGTIREKCRDGVVARVALKPRRRNTSGVLVLADVSGSMAPWRPFLQVFADSLAPGQLRVAEMFYFSNVPRSWVFETPALDERVEFDAAARQRTDLPLLVLGDAGAARGYFNPQRVRHTRDFLERATRHFRPIVWLNPMPRQRWAGTSASALLRQHGLSMLPLDKESLIRAVDILRGTRQL
jgi:hypothetical protein